MRVLLVLTLAVLTDCGASAPPASLSLNELDELAAEIEGGVAVVDEAFCDAGGGDPMANCYIGIATAIEGEAREVVCSDVLPIVEERTSDSVSYVAFDTRDDQTVAICRVLVAL